jgi:penicillin G amidase
MSTETITPAAVRKPHSWTRIAALIFAVVLLLVLGALGWLYWTARSALPQVDGTLALRGLTQPVTVSRDRLGVPAIEAASLEDLFFAQGYVTAQDRLWQMDVMRRFAAGELAEVLGPGLTRHDREQRILGLRVAAEKTIQVAAPETKAQFEAYARGVNAYIESRARGHHLTPP